MLFTEVTCTKWVDFPFSFRTEGGNVEADFGFDTTSTGLVTSATVLLALLRSAEASNAKTALELITVK